MIEIPDKCEDCRFMELIGHGELCKLFQSNLDGEYGKLKKCEKCLSTDINKTVEYRAKLVKIIWDCKLL